MITDARVLQDSFVPEEVVHRNSELNQLSGALEPLLHEEPPENVCLFGPTGAGKTCCARYAVDQLREAMLDVNTQYVNCWNDYNRYRVFYRLLDGIGRTLDVHRQSTPQDVLFERLRERDNQPYVVILDEVDQLQDRDVLYDLYTLPAVTMVLIANDDAEFFASLDDRLYSRLTGSEHVSFDRYSLDELVAILESRVQWGLVDDAVGQEELGLIADAAAGDARIAISILRTAARHAQRAGADRLTKDDIEAAIPKAQTALHKTTIDQLIADQQLLYEIIDEHTEIAPGTLYDEYERRADDPKSRRMVRNYLSKMEQYDVIEAEGEKRGRLYRISETTIGSTDQ